MLPISQCDLNLTASQKGILASASYVGIICSSHLWGFLADTKGRRSVIYPTLLVAFFVSIASSFVQNFQQFVVTRFLSGFFVSGSSATIYAYLSEFHDSKHRYDNRILNWVLIKLTISTSTLWRSQKDLVIKSKTIIEKKLIWFCCKILLQSSCDYAMFNNVCDFL